MNDEREDVEPDDPNRDLSIENTKDDTDLSKYMVPEEGSPLADDQTAKPEPTAGGDDETVVSDNPS